jgi:hypothetical protein
MAAAAIAGATIDLFSLYFYFTRWRITNGHISVDGYVLVGV